jgi:tetratricopeptide (TPR) repeat protein
MNKFEQQQRQQATQQLNSLLNAIPVPQKADNEWRVLQNELFARLEAEPSQRPRLASASRWESLLAAVWMRPALITAALVLIAVPVLIIQLNQGAAVKPLSSARILSCSSDVQVADAGGPGRLPTAASLELTTIHKGQVFETGPNGTLTVQLDSGTAFNLSSNSRLRIAEADSLHIILHLERGGILSMVSKRTQDQTFAVTTPNARCNVVGTVFSVSLVADSQHNQMTDLTVYEGKVVMTGIENQKASAVAETGQHLALFNKAMQDVENVKESASTIRDISLLKLSLESAQDTFSSDGLAELTSTPSGASVILDNRLLGQTPLILKYPAGQYAVRICTPGYQDWSGTLTVNRKEKAQLRAQLALDRPAAGESRARSVRHVRAKALSRSDGKDEYVNQPEYVEALIQMNLGEYRKALSLLESLYETPDVSNKDRKHIIRKISLCYKGIGDFTKTLKNLQQSYTTTTGPSEKGSFLWQIATVKAQCLEDYRGAVKDLQTYIAQYPDGAWIESAYLKCAELSYFIGDTRQAAEMYSKYIEQAPKSVKTDRALYCLAQLTLVDMKQPRKAAALYNRLLAEFPGSGYIENTLFELGESLMLSGSYDAARKYYQKYLSRYPQGRWAQACSEQLATSY